MVTTVTINIQIITINNCPQKWTYDVSVPTNRAMLTWINT